MFGGKKSPTCSSCSEAGDVESQSGKRSRRGSRSSPPSDPGDAVSCSDTRSRRGSHTSDMQSDAGSAAGNTDTKSRRTSRSRGSHSDPGDLESASDTKTRRGSHIQTDEERFEETQFSKKERAQGCHRPQEAPKEFDGPAHLKRRTTDTLCLLIMIAAWVIMTVIGSEALKQGNPYILINGIDDKGRICGIDEAVEDTSKFYPVLLRGVGVCIDSCPKETADTSDVHNKDLWLCLSDVEESEKQDEVDKCILDDMIMLTNPGCICNFIWKSVDVLNTCVITDGIVEELFKTDESNYVEDFFASVWMAAPVIFGLGIGGALAASFVYARLLTVPCVARLMVWGAIIGVFAFLVSLAIVLQNKANEYAREDPQIKTDDEIKAIRITSYVFEGIAGLYFCLMLFLRKRIGLGISVVKQASRVILAMPVIVLTPFIQFLGTALFVAVWTVYAIFLAGTSTVTTKDLTNDDTSASFKVLEYSDKTKQRAWVLLFILFWTLNFIVAMGQIGNALAFSTWYFTRDKKSVGNLAVFGSYCKAFRYHTGTAAFGSLIIAIIQMIRAVLMYIRRKAKLEGNRVAELVYSILMCVMCCVEKCIKFINKNAYIQTAITGKSFMPAAKAAFFLILRNILRISALNLISSFLLFVGKMFATAASVAVAYYVMVDLYDSEMKSMVAPLCLVFLLAWQTSEMFCGVFDMATDTIIQCFVLDEEWYGKENSFAERELRQFIEKHGGSKRLKKRFSSARAEDFNLDEVHDDDL